MAVSAAFGGNVVWHCEVEKSVNKLLEHRFPEVPNLGDVSQVDWNSVERVDVLCGGFPCQDVSSAGKRAGIVPGTRSGLWTMFASAIEVIRPRHVIIENVRGILSAKAHRSVESGEGDLGEGESLILKAMGAVLGDLSDLGYDARWKTVSAASVGAPHRRDRVFIHAYPRRVFSHT